MLRALKTQKTPLKRFFSTSVVRLNATHPDPKAGTSTSEFIDSKSPYAVTTYSRPNLVFAKGKGSYLYDLDNRRYVDFGAGVAVTGLGHSDEGVAKIMADQSQTLIHCSNLYHNLYTGELCEKLVKKTKESGGMFDAARVFLCNSGTEANEAALKFARKYGKTISQDKYELITFETSFHGRSMGALSVTANKKYQDPFAPLIPGIKVAKPNDLESVKALISEKTCGVIIEPIQGEGGINPIDKQFLVDLKQLCKQHNALLIYDEIQCGLGRSGKLWAHSYLPKEGHPDIISIAKALGNGFPIGATMITEQVEKALNVGDHGSTYGGNPLGSRIGSYVLDQISNEEFLSQVREKSAIISERLNELAGKFSQLISVKGEGLLLGAGFDQDPTPIVNACRERGLILITAGNNVIRFVPALNTPDEVIKEGMDIFEQGLEAVFKN